MNFPFGFEKAAAFNLGLKRRARTAKQGGLPWRQELAVLDAGLEVGTRVAQTRCITVTGDRSVPVSLQASLGTLVGRLLRRQQGHEQNYG
jgi:hypothetical protein